MFTWFTFCFSVIHSKIYSAYRYTEIKAGLQRRSRSMIVDARCTYTEDRVAGVTLKKCTIFFFFFWPSNVGGEERVVWCWGFRSACTLGVGQLSSFLGGLVPPGEKCLICAAVISPCHQATQSLLSLGLAVATTSGLSTTSLVGSPFGLFNPFRVSSWGHEYGTTAQTQCNTKLGLVPFLPFFLFQPSSSSFLYCCLRVRVSK